MKSLVLNFKLNNNYNLLFNKSKLFSKAYLSIYDIPII